MAAEDAVSTDVSSKPLWRTDGSAEESGSNMSNQNKCYPLPPVFIKNTRLLSCAALGYNIYHQLEVCWCSETCVSRHAFLISAGPASSYALICFGSPLRLVSGGVDAFTSWVQARPAPPCGPAREGDRAAAERIREPGGSGPVIHDAHLFWSYHVGGLRQKL